MADKKQEVVADKANLDVKELMKELNTSLEKRAKLEFQHQVTPLKNPLELRLLRREIARLKTYIRAKEAAK